MKNKVIPVLLGMSMMASNLQGESLVDKLNGYFGTVKSKAVQVKDSLKNRLPDRIGEVGYEVIQNKGYLSGELVNASGTSKLKLLVDPDLAKPKIRGLEYEAKIMEGESFSLSLVGDKMDDVYGLGFKSEKKLDYLGASLAFGGKFVFDKNFEPDGSVGTIGLKKQLSDKLTATYGSDIESFAEEINAKSFLKGSYQVNDKLKVDFSIGGSNHFNRPSIGLKYQTGLIFRDSGVKKSVPYNAQSSAREQRRKEDQFTKKSSLYQK